MQKLAINPNIPADHEFLVINRSASDVTYKFLI